MAYNYLPRDLAKRLRNAGLKVVEIEGWQRRGRPASTGSFDPVGVLWHHTGGASDGVAYSRWMTLEGRSDLPAPLAQLGIGRDGTVYVQAAGRANHAGTARASGSVAGGDGNALYVGVECMNTGSEGWSRAQYDAMVKTGVVLAEILGTSANAQRAHRETSVTGKWDPGLLNMDKFREDLREAMNAPEEDTRPAVSLKRIRKAATTPAWRLTIHNRKVLADKRRVKDALKAEGLDNYRQWQNRRKVSPTGIPDRESLTRLGNKHGFRVVA